MVNGRFGIHAQIESASLKALQLAIRAAFTTRQAKLPFLKQLQVEIELLKRLVRLGYELAIYKQRVYLSIQRDLQEISKMTAGWIKYIERGSM